MKQTAVEWLVDKFSTQGTLHSSDISQAKEMEREQIVEAYEKGEFNQGCNESSEQYYVKTYKK